MKQQHTWLLKHSITSVIATLPRLNLRQGNVGVWRSICSPQQHRTRPLGRLETRNLSTASPDSILLIRPAWERQTLALTTGAEHRLDCSMAAPRDSSPPAAAPEPPAEPLGLSKQPGVQSSSSTNPRKTGCKDLLWKI